MGDYAAEAPPDLVTVRKHPEHPTEIADLMGRRLVVASETEQGAELRLQLIKRMTGNARLKGRLMRRDYFEFARTHKLVLVTNNKPALRENTEAVWRRLRMVPFNVIIPPEERDMTLLQKLQAEWPGILTWLVRGCVEWLAEGLTEPRAVTVATLAYRSRANSVEAFLKECCSIGQGLYTPTAHLVHAYVEWCARNRCVPVQGRALADALKAKGCEPGKIGGDRHWLHICVNEPEPGRNGQNGH